ncbi:MAG: glycosyltransferase [Fusicatenibacter sp.]|nr:glycosyltransferase [Fusicatenibacter sp.]
MNPTVSIIVPVYNSELYLERCVDSILGQEYTDFELILTDDGSGDASGRICDEYAARDPRVHVIHKENSGVSDSRNRAISEARGTYLQFVDSDDWITPDATRLLVQAAELSDSDLVIADFYRVIGERLSPKGDIEEDGVLTREEFADCMMKNPADFYYGVLWNKLYRRDIVEKNELRMNTQISWCEDFMFNLEYICYANRFYALHAPIYYYVKTKGSLVSQGTSITKTIKMKFMVFEYYNNFYKHVYEEEEYEKKRLWVYRFLLDAAGDGTVPPAILPGSKKLGEERAGIYQQAIEGEGVLNDAYRDRKLLERALEIAAMKNDMTLLEAKMLLCMEATGERVSKKELADFAGVSRSQLNGLLKKLVYRELIRTEEQRSVKAERGMLQITFLPASESVLSSLHTALEEYEQEKFAGFGEEELIQYACLSEKIKENIQKRLL